MKLKTAALTLSLVLALSTFAIAAEPDKDLTILQLRRALVVEKMERLRLEYIITKAELDRIEAELKQREPKPEVKNEN